MTPYYQDGAVTIYHGDCREILPQLKTDVITITDPPYNIGFKSQRRGEGYSIGKDKLSENDYLALLKVAAPGKSIVTCGKQNLKLWLCNFQVLETAIWIAKNKMSGGRVSHLSLWEPIVFIGEFGRGSRPTDLYEVHTSFQADADDHPCPKPLGLFTDLIQHYTGYLNVIRDPFMGSGTTLRAAKDLGRKAEGFDISEEYCEIAAKRMAQEVFDFA